MIGEACKLIHLSFEVQREASSLERNQYFFWTVTLYLRILKSQFVCGLVTVRRDRRFFIEFVSDR